MGVKTYLSFWYDLVFAATTYLVYSSLKKFFFTGINFSYFS